MKTEERQKGYEFVEGMTDRLTELFWWAVAILILLTVLRNLFGWDVDDSDRDGWTRSGLIVHTDYKTGVQYLSDGKGGLTPRLEKAP